MYVTHMLQLGILSNSNAQYPNVNTDIHFRQNKKDKNMKYS